jgi:hypothetical protein
MALSLFYNANAFSSDSPIRSEQIKAWIRIHRQGLPVLSPLLQPHLVLNILHLFGLQSFLTMDRTKSMHTLSSLSPGVEEP